MERKIFNISTDDSKIYKQILAFLNFSIEATPQEREVLAEIIQLNNEYEALPPKQRAKFILSTDMRKEIREKLDIEEKQFNVIISRVKKKTMLGKPIFDDDGILNPHLIFKPDSEGMRIEINLVNVIAKKTKVVEKIEEVEQPLPVEQPVIKTEEPRKLAPPANGKDNIITEGLPSGFIILEPNG